MFEQGLPMSPSCTPPPPVLSDVLAKRYSFSTDDPGYADRYFQVVHKISRIIGTWHFRVLVAPGDEFMGLEAAIASIVGKGDRVVVLSNGPWGDEVSTLIRAYGAEPVVFRGDPRKRICCDKALSFIEEAGDVKAVVMAHCDESTGVLNDPSCIGRKLRSSNMVFILDARATSFACNLNADDWGVNVVVAGVKGPLGIPGGVMILSVDRKAWDMIEERKLEGAALNLRLWRRFIERVGSPPWITPPFMLSLIEDALDNILVEGEDNVYARNARARDACWSACRELGFKPFPESIEHASPTLTSMEPPKGMAPGDLKLELRCRWSLLLGEGKGWLRGKVLTIAHMGRAAAPQNVLQAWILIAKLLEERGIVEKGATGRVAELIAEAVGL